MPLLTRSYPWYLITSAATSHVQMAYAICTMNADCIWPAAMTEVRATTMRSARNVARM